MFSRIAIVNRGEAAMRLIHAVRDLNAATPDGPQIETVALHTEGERRAMFVREADRAYDLGPAANRPYLDYAVLEKALVETGADAAWVGWGFVAEDPGFAELCARIGVTFIGPSAEAMRKLGDKIGSKLIAEEVGVPVAPWSRGGVDTLEEATEAAARIGYPLMLKATAGGGGRGIRRVDSDADLRDAYERTRDEAARAFGSGVVFLEKLVTGARHIEVQVIADGQGTAWAVGVRDCSIQRRNQKLIEIAPSPQLTPEQRAYIGDLAVRAAKAVNYENAGTVEFLLADGEVYFMEMNTRVQVEHTITEEITGIDIVREQIRIASGLPLSVKQEDIQHRGYALQFRINAEDPKNNFLPSFGKITRYYAPGGPGVRTDTAIYTGYTIPPFYDSMCLKLVVWALTWEEAMDRGLRALDDMRVQGVKTTAAYYQEILRNPEFRSGQFNTSFVESHPELTNYSIKRKPEELALAIAAAIAAHAGL